MYIPIVRNTLAAALYGTIAVSVVARRDKNQTPFTASSPAIGDTLNRKEIIYLSVQLLNQY